VRLHSLVAVVDLNTQRPHHHHHHHHQLSVTATECLQQTLTDALYYTRWGITSGTHATFCRNSGNYCPNLMILSALCTDRNYLRVIDLLTYISAKCYRFLLFVESLYNKSQGVR